MSSSLGTRLRETRERKGVSLTAIAERTKISVALLEGLERDDVSRWPGGIFRRAWIRAYAQSVGLEPEPIVKEFVELYPDPVEQALADAAAAQAHNGATPTSRLALLRAGLAVFHAEQAEAPAARPPVPNGPPRTEPAALERELRSVSGLCTALGRAKDREAVDGVLQDVARVLGARGVILWVWNAGRAALSPAFAHGYSDHVLQRLARLTQSPDTAVAAAFRSGEERVIEGSGPRATGAFVAPLLTPAGCAGVLAIEFSDGGEQRESTRAFATILAAQLSTLLPASTAADTSGASVTPDQTFELTADVLHG
jgi:transcriptional regulator with XRE-family HTH domain